MKLETPPLGERNVSLPKSFFGGSNFGLYLLSISWEQRIERFQKNERLGASFDVFGPMNFGLGHATILH